MTALLFAFLAGVTSVTDVSTVELKGSEFEERALEICRISLETSDSSDERAGYERFEGRKAILKSRFGYDGGSTEDKGVDLLCRAYLRGSADSMMNVLEMFKAEDKKRAVAERK